MVLGESSTVTIGLLIVIVAASWALWRWWGGVIRGIETEARNEREKLRREVEEMRRDLEGQIVGLRRDEAAFELEVAKHYASDDRLQAMEQKFTGAIEKLINRFDAFATDFHRVLGRLEREKDE